jgi:radical SAM superfamily enzyme YgiQ (UPF0313 family)
MKLFLVYVRDEDFYSPLPEAAGASPKKNGRVKVMAFPPIGIETLAPVIRQRGHVVRMFDTCHPQMKEEHIARALREERPDAVAISFLSTTSYPAAKSMARTLKQAEPGIPTIFGGVFATMNPKQVMKDCPHADFLGVGDGELLIPDFLDHLDSPGEVLGLVWRNGDEIVANPPRPLLLDLDQFPYPDRQTLPIDYIESMPLDVPAVLSLEKFATMQTSRGCPWTCIFCDIPSLGGGRWRSRSPESVLGEMQQLQDLGYRSIYLTDDHFLLQRKRITAICEGIIERGFEFSWGCEGRVDSVAVDRLPLMAKANCGFLAFGIESGVQRILTRLKKDQTLEQIEHAVSAAKQHGVKTAHGFFLIGNPGETVDDILESFRFAARLKLDTFGFNRLCAYRGTPLWKEYIERGIIDDDRDWYKWFKCSDIDPTVLPSEVVNRARRKGYALLFRYRFLRRPVSTLRVIRRFARYMRWVDVLRLLSSPFRKRKLFRKPELPARMIDAGLGAPVRGPASAVTSGP